MALSSTVRTAGWKSLVIAACFFVSASGLLVSSSARDAGATTATATQQSASKYRVTDFRNMPLPGVAIKLQPQPAVPLPDLVQESTLTTTTAQGDFELPAGTQAESIIVLEKAGFGMLAYNAAKLPPRVILPPAAPLIGTIIDDRGVSVSNALIGPIEPPAKCEHGPQDAPHPTVSPLLFARSDASGMFRVPNLPIHKYSFLVRRDGIQPTLITGKTGIPMQLLVYRGGTTVTGVLIGTKDKQPQPGVYVEAADAQTRLYGLTDHNGMFEFPNLQSREWLFKPYLGPSTGNHSARALAVSGPEGPTTLTLLLNQGSRIAGQLMNDETSEPLAGIPIGISAGGLRDSMITDSSGRFEFNDVDALENYTLRFDPLRYIHVMPDGQMRDYYNLLTREGENRENLVVTLRKRALVQGRVVDTSSNPVNDALVVLRSTNDSAQSKTADSEHRRPHSEFSVHANAAGEFKIGVYPGGRYEVTATTQDDRAAEPKVIDAYTTSPEAKVELRLQSTVSLGGIVLDGNDNPVSAAVVLALPPSQRGSRNPSAYQLAKFPNARTNEQGEFEITNLAMNQKVLLAASHPDFISTAESVLVAGSLGASTTASVKLRFPGGQDFNARVTDATGIAVPEAVVALHYLEGMDGKQITRTTDVNGRVIARALPASKLERLTVRRTGYADHELPGPILMPQSDLVIQLKRKSNVLVKLAGTPAAQPENARPHAAVLFGVLSTNSSPEPEATAYTEQERREFAEGAAQFANVSPGWYKAALSGGGAFVESKPVYIAGDAADTEITIEAPPISTIRGRIVDKATQKPVPGAAVTMGPAAQTSQPEADAARTVYADAAGNFELQNAPVGMVGFKVVAFGYPEYQQTLQVSGSAPIEIKLSNEPGALAGTITLAGQPVKEALLVLASPKAHESPVASSITDESGRYAMNGFPTGSYVLTIEAPAGTGDTTTRRSVTVEVADVNSRQDIDLPAMVKISGTVKLGGKAPARPDGTAPSILFSPRSGGGEGRIVQLTAEGTFDAEIEPGTYSVGLDDQPGQDVEIRTAPAERIDLLF